MIDTDVLDRVLARAVRSGAGFAEVFAEDRRSTSLAFDDGRVDRVTSGRDRGAGIRVVNGSTTGYAHTADLSETGLLAAADAAAAAAGSGSDGQRVVGPVGARDDGARHSPVATPPAEIAKSARVDLLLAADEAARSAGAEIVQVSAGVGDTRRSVLIANTDGVHVADDVTRVLFRVSAVADGDAGMQTGYRSLGHTV
ncbi:MAG: DNA gyrase modulator, partial [Ilumatobacter sp.]